MLDLLLTGQAENMKFRIHTRNPEKIEEFLTKFEEGLDGYKKTSVKAKIAGLDMMWKRVNTNVFEVVMAMKMEIHGTGKIMKKVLLGKLKGVDKDIEIT